MLKSMTAFGRASGTLFEGMVNIEVKSVNNRYLDTILHLPKKYASLEELVRKTIAGCFARGRIELSLRVDGDNTAPKNIEADMELAKAYCAVLNSVERELGLTGGISLSLVASFKDVIVVKETEPDLEAAWVIIKEVLDKALETVGDMRRAEGEILSADLLKRLDLLSSLVNDIQGHMADIRKDYYSRLRQRIFDLVGNVEVDPNRLAQEVAIQVDRSDITEEAVRIGSHITQFRALIDQDGPAGRRLDFLIQEMSREANTMGSKAADAFIAHKVIDMKCELEKLREQVQNIE